MKKLILSIVAMLTLATSAFAQLGNLSADLVFTPLTPCRIVDTRVAGGTIAAGTTRSFKAWGSSFAAQGGAATNCGIPQNTNVAALELNLVVVGTLADGYITAFPFGVAQPNASTLNYVAGAVLANGATVKVSQASLASDWSVFTLATTHFVADVTGYYSRPVATALECIEVAGPTVTVAGGDLHFGLSAPACTAGYTLVGIGFSSPGSQLLRKDGRLSYLFVRNTSASAQTATPYAACCRVPGR